ncbi:MAG: TolC family outer membrane protein [Proteobacteria bacterium]|nr:TolC family outer membrane protein [Pseudomonadota bacterium]
MFRKLSIALTAFGTLTAASAASAMSLSEALDMAASNNPQLLSARAAVRSSDEKLNQAEADYYPDVDANASWSNVNRDFSNGTNSKSHPKNYGVTLKQEIFSGFGTLAATRAARNTLKATEAGLSELEQSVLLDAVSVYIDVLRDLEVVKLNSYQVEVLDKQLEATKSRFKLGEVTQTDVQQAEARLAAARAEAVNAEGTLVTSRAKFEEIIGTAPENLDWPALHFTLPDNADEVMDRALSEHPSLVKSLAVLAAQKYTVEGAKSYYYPSLSAQATMEKNIDASGGVNGDFENRTVSLNLSVPLFHGGENVSRVRQTIADREGAEQDYQDVRRNVKRELVDAMNLYKTVKARQVSLEDAVEANRLALRGVEKEAEVGSRTVLDVLDARQEYLSAQVDLAGAKHDSLVSAFRLKAAMGELTGDNLKALFAPKPVDGTNPAEIQFDPEN